METEYHKPPGYDRARGKEVCVKYIVMFVKYIVMFIENIVICINFI